MQVTPIEILPFGYAGDKEIFLFKLCNNNGCELLVTNYGATAVSLKVHNKYRYLTDVLLGYDSIGKYINDTVYMGAVVGRCANRIAGPTIPIDDKEYELPLRKGGFHAHGGVEGFNKKVFDYSFSCVEGLWNLSFHYKSIHLEEGYPGNLDITVTYTLDNDNRWIIDYKATTDQTTIINPTQHAYFNLSGNADTVTDNHYLQIYAEQYLSINDMVIPTGEFSSVENTPFDFRKARKIGNGMNVENEQMQKANGYDHGWVLKHTPNKELLHAATVFEVESGIQLDLYTTEPDLHFYAGNWLDKSIIGKHNQCYDVRSGFCLETQHFPDAPNKPHFPSIVLKNGEKFNSKTVFSFSIKK